MGPSSPRHALTPEERLANAQHACEAFALARDAMRKERTPAAALAYCKAAQALKDARAAIPKPRLVQ